MMNIENKLTKIKESIANKLLNNLYGIKCKDIKKHLKTIKTNKPFEILKRRVLWDNKSTSYKIKDVEGLQGINSVGFYRENIGLSHSARYFTKALIHSNMPFIAKNFDIRTEKKENFEFDDFFSDELKYNTSVFNFNSNYCTAYAKAFPEDMKKKYNIGYGYWEFEKYPLKFLNQNNIFDEIWAPTDFILNALSKYYAIPVVKMPVAVDFDVKNIKKYNRKYFKLPENKFIFLFSFDVGSEVGGRKNCFGVIDAFNKAFNKEDNVCLLIKATPRTTEQQNPEYDEILQKLNKSAKQKNIILMNETLLDDEMKGLLNSADVYVSLHRCEGLGLGMIESMKLGKPVIGTGYSGNLEFMNHNNSCLVDYTLVPSSLFSNIIEGHLWAEPDIENAAFYMKKIFEDKEYYNKISKAAKKHIEENHSFGVIATKIKERLSLLGLLDEDI